MDGLRGVAALLVLLHHIELTRGGTNWLLHGYLAVDLFFVLSGFVIGHAYERRLTGGMQLREFARQRLIRLYPLIALGALVGFIGAVLVLKYGAAGQALALQLLFIPVLWRAGDIFILNGVQWSLFFELLANAVHALSLRWLTTALLALGVAASALALGLTAWRFGDLGVGWGAQNFWGGLARVSFSYGVGLLLFRLHKRDFLPRLTVPWPVLAAAPLILALFARRAGWMGDVLAVFTFPPLVAASLSTRLPPMVGRAAAFIGLLSYPVYALQGPVKLLVRPWIQPLPPGPELFGWAGYVVLLAVLSWAAVRFIDEPIRRRLQRARLELGPTRGG